MMFHASIAVNEPERVAKVIGELWGGTAVEFVPLNNGSWIALAPDDRNTAMEVYPRGKLFSVELESGMAPDPDINGKGLTATHVAIGTVLTPDEVYAIGKREGWTARAMRRKLGFDVIELWVEDRVMLEVLTDYMQKEYLEAATIPRWEEAMAKAKAARAAAGADAPKTAAAMG
jgi:hypothetical protein